MGWGKGRGDKVVMEVESSQMVEEGYRGTCDCCVLFLHLSRRQVRNIEYPSTQVLRILWYVHPWAWIDLGKPHPWMDRMPSVLCSSGSQEVEEGGAGLLQAKTRDWDLSSVPPCLCGVERLPFAQLAPPIGALVANHLLRFRQCRLHLHDFVLGTRTSPTCFLMLS